MTPIYQEVDIQAIERESNALVVKANSFDIVNNDVYIEAMEFAKTIKAMQKEVDAAFDPIVKQNHAAWKAAIAQKTKYYEPLEKALKFLDTKGRIFRTEQERLRIEEERKAQELARKEAERLQKLAEKAKARGDEEKAESFEVKAQEAANITPVVAPKVAAVEGIKVRKIWKYRIVNANAIPREYLIPNEVMLGQVARATKGTLPIPGVEFYSEDSSI